MFKPICLSVYQLGSEECTPDGSMGRNPLTSVANGLLNTFTAHPQHQEEYESAPYQPSGADIPPPSGHMHRPEHEWMPDFHAMQLQRHQHMMSAAWHRSHMPPPPQVAT